MRKSYIVCGKSYDGMDSNEWNVAVYLDERKARNRMDEAEQEALRLNTLHHKVVNGIENDENCNINKYDDNMVMNDYIDYHIETFDLEE